MFKEKFVKNSFKGLNLIWIWLFNIIVVLITYVVLHSVINYLSNIFIKKVEKNIWNHKVELISNILVFCNKYFPLIFIILTSLVIVWKLLVYK